MLATPGQLVLATPARLVARWWLGLQLLATPARLAVAAVAAVGPARRHWPAWAWEVAFWAWASMVGVARPHLHAAAAASSWLLEAALVVVEAVEAALVATVLARLAVASWRLLLEAALLPVLAAGRHWLAVPDAALPPCSPPPPPLLLLLVLLPVLPVPGPVLAVLWRSALLRRHWPAGSA